MTRITRLAAQSDTQFSTDSGQCSTLHYLHTGHDSSDTDVYVIAKKTAFLMDTDYSQHTREKDVAYLRRSQKIVYVQHLEQKYMTAEGIYFERLTK